jgi:DNA-binding transcriptional MerR regulator
VTRSGAAAAGIRRITKSDTAFRTTSEVAEELDLPPHVLRFWEAKFPEIKPLKRGGGRRYYRPEDVDLFRRIRRHLYQEGYTIRGVQKLLREREPRHSGPPLLREQNAPAPLFALEPLADASSAPPRPAPPRQALRAALEDVRRELIETRLLLDKLLAE